MRSLNIYVFVACLGLMGCVATQAEQENCRAQSATVPAVVRVFMHEVGRYSIMTEDPSTHALVAERAYGDVVADVPAGDTMWAYKTGYADGYHASSCSYRLTIHVHRAADVNGAGWNHGKLGRGMTTPVE